MQGLTPATRYIVAAAAVNPAGQSSFGLASAVFTTQVEDLLGACVLYPVPKSSGSVASASPAWGSGAGGELVLARAGDNVTIDGQFLRMRPGIYSLHIFAYGLSRTGESTLAALSLPPAQLDLSYAETAAGRASDTSYVISRTYSASVAATALPLVGSSSIISAALVLFGPGSNGAAAAQCEVGVARPSSLTQINAAAPPAPPTSGQAGGYCRLLPLATASASFPSFSGTLLFAGEAGSVHVRARLCGLSGGGLFPLRMMGYGDLRGGPDTEGWGGVAANLGWVEADDNQAGLFDVPAATGLTLQTGETGSLLGRVFVLFQATTNPSLDLPTSAALAACVAGAADPSLTAVEPAPCRACTHTTGQSETLSVVGMTYGLDWLSVWSLNPGLIRPDLALSPGQSVYYAHPFEVRSGETLASVRSRFGMSVAQFWTLNPFLYASGVTELSVGDVVCISVDWQVQVGPDGRRICPLSTTSSIVV
mmetsp:Transcript_30624/g.81846  ORF Transcript_30624/g.81846 Transcript_30624/m.81846 type:complete len:480 (+) Transcript_30624:1363-2802(+)